MSTLPRDKRRVYRDVGSLMAGLGLPGEVAARVAGLKGRTQVVDWLVSERTRAGLTQSELAARLRCSQSRISKLEDSADADLRLGDIAAYCRALSGRRQPRRGS